MARLELIRTLRDLGLGLEDVRRVLERETTTVAAVAAVHVEALDAQTGHRGCAARCSAAWRSGSRTPRRRLC
ncbi:MerR family DNA-binding protein [Actinacidiphila glaucinigra]|uniref:MerR family DNA-binding protein n=1 Tax=Actinacidiphila glaucinigra TaxID=235986 RepID=UPI0037F484DF